MKPRIAVYYGKLLFDDFDLRDGYFALAVNCLHGTGRRDLLVFFADVLVEFLGHVVINDVVLHFPAFFGLRFDDILALVGLLQRALGAFAFARDGSLAAFFSFFLLRVSTEGRRSKAEDY